MRSIELKSLLLAGASAALLVSAAHAENFNIPRGDLDSALEAYMMQSGVTLVLSNRAVHGIKSPGVRGDLSSSDALDRILNGTGFIPSRNPSGVIEIVRGGQSSDASDIRLQPMQLAQAAPASHPAVETVTVTSSKLGGADVQSIPIAITALSQEQLTASQTNGGPDLVKQVPNLTFTKTNFAGYSIQIRGVGTQAISVTTDPAVAVAFNDIPFIRNHFFEQEFFDVGQVEVLRGPQGTLYGRNATAGVVNLLSAKPTDQFEAAASGELGNYGQRRFEGMINLPLVDDRFDMRIAGEWTKRQGYSFNETSDERIDGRDLWSGRLSIGWKPFEKLQTQFVWEHFSENDDRIRSSKQLCNKSPIPTEINGVPITQLPFYGSSQGPGGGSGEVVSGLSQGCQAASLYSPASFQVVNGFPLPYVAALTANINLAPAKVDPYASVTQSPNLRVIQSELEPQYKAKNDIVELHADYSVTPELTFISETGYNHDFLYSAEDYNRFNTTPDFFSYNPTDLLQGGNLRGQIVPDGNYRCADGSLSIGGNSCAPGPAPTLTGTFCDPQLGCSNKLLAEDLSEEHSWQFNQEFRLASNFSGPLNFSIGGNFLHYETEENYYVFFNSLTLWASVGPTEGGRIHAPWVSGVSDNSECLQRTSTGGFQYPKTNAASFNNCVYIDPNPISDLNDEGHNYFLSQNPYILNSYASFGEVYYNLFKNLKLTAGLRWTEDRKHFAVIPSELLTNGAGYPVTGTVDQQWDQFTGRFNATWTPHLNFTDQTLLYGSYSHGYKAGGANPPGAIILEDAQFQPTHPLTFKPEFVDAFELGTKNTLLDGALTLNGDLFYYNYENYQISEIVDRTAINQNFDAHIKGAEIELTYEPVPGLRFNFSGGYEDARLASGSQAVDLMDRTAGNSNWMVIRPDITAASNCILPSYVVMITGAAIGAGGIGGAGFCQQAYVEGFDPVTGKTYAPPPAGGYPGAGHAGYTGFDPWAGTASDPYTGQNIANGIDYGPAPNNGEGFNKDLSHNEMPNAPPFTMSFGTQYSLPVSSDWAATLRGDLYWQDASYWRVFNDLSYDKLHAYSNLNFTLILTNQAGWQVMVYDKNVFNTTAITGAFLNSDDSGLTTNVFLTDPRLIGIRVTKNW